MSQPNSKIKMKFLSLTFWTWTGVVRNLQHWDNDENQKKKMQIHQEFLSFHLH